MLAVAVNWHPDRAARPIGELMADPAVGHYVQGWPIDGDYGLIAEITDPIGAAWWRSFANSDPGYGFVDEETPEVTIGVSEAARGQGVGTTLLASLIRRARLATLPALSLSVEPDNPAARLYARLGFEIVGGTGGAQTMLLHLAARKRG